MSDKIDTCFKLLEELKKKYNDEVSKHSTAIVLKEDELNNKKNEIDAVDNQITECNNIADSCLIERPTANCGPEAWTGWGNPLNSINVCKKEFGDNARVAIDQKSGWTKWQSPTNCSWFFKRAICIARDERKKENLLTKKNKLQREYDKIQTALTDLKDNPPRLGVLECNVCQNTVNCTDVQNCKDILQSCQQEISKKEQTTTPSTSSSTPPSPSPGPSPSPSSGNTPSTSQSTTLSTTDNKTKELFGIDKKYLIYGGIGIGILIILIVIVLLMKKK